MRALFLQCLIFIVSIDALGHEHATCGSCCFISTESLALVGYFLASIWFSSPSHRRVVVVIVWQGC